MNTPKVFGIGIQKTGTSSIKRALRQLGYRVATALGVHDPHIARDVYDLAFGLLDRYDAFQDNPWAILYKELDEWCPGSKFILTVRPAEKWIQSVVHHFGGSSTPMREWIYRVGDPIGNEKIYIQRPVGRAELDALAALARDEERAFFERNPHLIQPYRSRLVAAALCQGAALQYLDIGRRP